MWILISLYKSFDFKRLFMVIRVRVGDDGGEGDDMGYGFW